MDSTTSSLDSLYSLITFSITLAITIGMAMYGGKKAAKEKSQSLSDHGINKWLLGLSAGATANSGFVVAGAVGLGYLYGITWLLLPIAWLLGDLIFWKFFPNKINKLGRETKARTINDIITPKEGTNISANTLKATVSIVILLSLGLYLMSQWVAGSKVVTGSFPTISTDLSIWLLGATVIFYTSIGGYRGSIYADATQAVIRIIGTLLAVYLIATHALSLGDDFTKSYLGLSAGYFNPLVELGLGGFFGFIAGFSCAALGFGLGQPQMVTRYISGKSEKEVLSAKPIYLIFVQFTWISMTIFGILLKGIEPNLADPEAGFGIYFREHAHWLVTGIIIADIFATVAATTNSVIITLAQTVVYDLFKLKSIEDRSLPIILASLVIGIITLLLSIYSNQSVSSLAINAAGYMAAALAPAMLLRLIDKAYSQWQQVITILIGGTTSIIWVEIGFNSTINQALPGMLLGIAYGLTHLKIVHSLKNQSEVTS